MRRIAVLALGILAVSASGQQPILLRVRAKPGWVQRYAVTATMIPAGQQGRIEMVLEMTEKVKSIVKKEQVWQVQSRVKKLVASGAMAEAKASMMALDGLAFLAHRDDRGRTLKMVVNGTSVATKGSSNLVFPDKAVKAGTTWRAPIETNGRVFTVEYRLDSLQRVGRRSVASISGRYVPGQAIKTTTPLDFKVDTKTGLVLSGAGAYKLEQGGVTINGSFSLRKL